MPRPSVTKKCLVCGKRLPRNSYTYCSNACQSEFQYQRYIDSWKAGKVKGLQCLGIVTRPIKTYLRRRCGDKCELCGWSKINPKTGKVPLVADHIDGNWQNNVETNLRLLCPNCDSLTPTYGGLNRGKGRNNRIPSKRRFEVGSLISG